MIRRALAAALLFALAACDTLSVRVTGEPTPLFRVEDPEYVGNGRDFRVVLLDDGATLGSRQALQTAALAGLQDNARFPTRFTTTPQTHNKDFRVVLIFNPAANLRATDLCREPAPPPRFAPSENLHVQGAFCRGGDLLTEADAYVSGIQTAGDSRFRAMIAAFVRQLFPSRDARVGDMPE